MVSFGFIGAQVGISIVVVAGNFSTTITITASNKFAKGLWISASVPVAVVTVAVQMTL